MGRTIPSYRMALEAELQAWKAFGEALREDDRKAFEELTDTCRRYASAAGAAARPVIFEGMLMSMLLSHQKTLREILAKLEARK